MSTEHASGGTASRRITELVREGRSYGFTSADGTLAGGFRTLSAAAEAAALYQLGRREHPDLAAAYLEGTAGDAIARRNRQELWMGRPELITRRPSPARG